MVWIFTHSPKFLYWNLIINVMVKRKWALGKGISSQLSWTGFVPLQKRSQNAALPWTSAGPHQTVTAGQQPWTSSLQKDKVAALLPHWLPSKPGWYRLVVRVTKSIRCSDHVSFLWASSCVFPVSLEKMPESFQVLEPQSHSGPLWSPWHLCSLCNTWLPPCHTGNLFSFRSNVTFYMNSFCPLSLQWLFSHLTIACKCI